MVRNKHPKLSNLDGTASMAPHRVHLANVPTRQSEQVDDLISWSRSCDVIECEAASLRLTIDRAPKPMTERNLIARCSRGHYQQHDVRLITIALRLLEARPTLL